MSRPSHRADGDIVRDFLSVANLLEEPQLAQLYAYLAVVGVCPHRQVFTREVTDRARANDPPEGIHAAVVTGQRASRAFQ